MQRRQKKDVNKRNWHDESKKAPKRSLVVATYGRIIASYFYKAEDEQKASAMKRLLQTLFLLLNIRTGTGWHKASKCHTREINEKGIQ